MARAKEASTLARLSIGALIGQFARRPGRRRPDPIGRRTSDRSLGRLDGDGGIDDGTLVAPGAARRSSGGARRRRRRPRRCARRLLARARIRDAADWLAHQPQLGWEKSFARGIPAASGSGCSLLTSPICAARHHAVALHVPEAQAAAYRPRPPPLWRVSDALPHLRRRLAGLPDGTSLPALLPRLDGIDPGRTLRCRAAVASTLVAGLELARDGALTLARAAAWVPIRVDQPARGHLTERRRQRDAQVAAAATGP